VVIGKAEEGSYIHAVSELEGREGGSFWEAAALDDDEEEEEDEYEAGNELGQGMGEDEDEDEVGVEGGREVLCCMP
jgi:hypothetical protein